MNTYCENWYLDLKTWWMKINLIFNLKSYELLISPVVLLSVTIWYQFTKLSQVNLGKMYEYAWVILWCFNKQKDKIIVTIYETQHRSRKFGTTV